jgi:predicted ATPase
MPQLTERCDVWRMVGTYDAGKKMAAVYTAAPCLRIPISGFSKLAAALSASNRPSSPSERFLTEARQSTSVFLIPSWMRLFTDDELRRGRRVDINGNAVAYRYTVNGIRDYEGLGYQDTLAVFCQSLQ